MSDCAILQGKEVVPCDDLMTWAGSFQNKDRILKKDFVNGVEISTVFLGINHGFGGPAKWFETMIFGGKHDQYQDRYSTYDEAMEGHQKALDLVK